MFHRIKKYQQRVHLIPWMAEGQRNLSIKRAGPALLLMAPLLVVSQIVFGQTISGSPGVSSHKASVQRDLSVAAQGDVQAQLRVARQYYADRNLAEAVRWFGAASRQGSLEATAWLGISYLEGSGIMQDVEKGRSLIEEAASKHDPVGLRFSGVMYQKGKGVSQDFVKAAALFTEATNLHDANSFSWLGGLYLRGLGVPKDAVKAKSLFTEGAGLGDSWSQLSLANLMLRENRNNPGQDRTVAVNLLKQSADQGNAMAAFQLGMAFKLGNIIPQDNRTAISYFRKSARVGFAPAQRELGSALATGAGVPPNPVRAFMWLSLADQQGDLLAAQQVAVLRKSLTPAQIAQGEALRSKWSGIMFGGN